MHAKNTKNVTVEPLVLKTYLAFITRSVGSPIFQEFYARVNGKTLEVTRDGNVSCSWFVSAVLKVFNLIGTVQITVHRTLDEMERNGWKRISRPRRGCVVLWAAKPSDTAKLKKYANAYYPMVKHLGFYIGDGMTVTNSGHETRKPKRYPLNYRRVEAYFWHRNLEEPSSAIVWRSPRKKTGRTAK